VPASPHFARAVARSPPTVRSRRGSCTAAAWRSRWRRCARRGAGVRDAARALLPRAAREKSAPRHRIAVRESRPVRRSPRAAISPEHRARRSLPLRELLTRMLLRRQTSSWRRTVSLGAHGLRNRSLAARDLTTASARAPPALSGRVPLPLRPGAGRRPSWFVRVLHRARRCAPSGHRLTAERSERTTCAPLSESRAYERFAH